MKSNKQKPFFAAFLENQLGEEEARNTQGGENNVTLKYPSDEEDNPPVTLKYPSDLEDAYTKPAADMLQTMKYPSDNDEDGTKI